MQQTWYLFTAKIYNKNIAHVPKNVSLFIMYLQKKMKMF